MRLRAPTTTPAPIEAEGATDALTSIRAMIDEDRVRARQMVTELAAFLRHALMERALATTTLAAELDALRGYLAIEQIRFEERLAIETHVEPAAESCAIPSSSKSPTAIVSAPVSLGASVVLRTSMRRREY